MGVKVLLDVGAAATPSPSWWSSMPDGLWALFGVVVTVLATSVIEFFRYRRTRAEARRTERLSAYSMLLGAASEYLRNVYSVLSTRNRLGAATDGASTKSSYERSLSLLTSEVARSQLVSNSQVSDEIAAIFKSFLDATSDRDIPKEQAASRIGEAFSRLRKLLRSELAPTEKRRPRIVGRR